MFFRAREVEIVMFLLGPLEPNIENPDKFVELDPINTADAMIIIRTTAPKISLQFISI